MPGTTPGTSQLRKRTTTPEYLERGCSFRFLTQMQTTKNARRKRPGDIGKRTTARKSRCGCRTEQWLQMYPDYKQCKLRRDGEPHERTWQCIVSKTGQNRFHKQIIQTEPAYFIWPAKIRHRCSFMPKKADAKANYQLYWRLPHLFISIRLIQSHH